MNRQCRTCVCMTGALAIVLPGWVAQAGSTDPQPTVARQVELPETPAGRCAGAYLEAFNSGDDDRMRDFTRRYRKESYLQKNPIERIIERYRTIHGAAGALTPIRILQSSEYELALLVRASLTSGFAEVRFEVDRQRPHKLVVFTIDYIGSSDAGIDSEPINDKIINATIDSVADILKERYVYPDKGQKMGDMLIRNKSEGRYAAITNASVFARKITEDLQSLSSDAHLAVRPGSPPHELPKTPGKPDRMRPGAKAQIDWPDTPAGRRAEAYFDVYNTGRKDDLRRFIKGHFSEEALKERSLEETLAFHSGMRSMAGKVTFHSASADGDFAVEVSLNAEKTGFARLLIEVSPGPPNGLVSFEDITPSVEDIRNNYGFRKVEVLPGNIGYIRFDQCHHSEEARETAAAALAFVANCDALIFDLRHNGGGTRHMSQFISSYLFDRVLHLGGLYNRLTDETTEWRTLEKIPGKRFGPDVPVYILTSSMTFSAAEAFAYCLKDLKRVTIVGEKTGGGAHPVHERAVNDRFWMRVPFARAISPVSKTDWEGVGVIPDIKVPASQAVEAACQDAAKRIQARRKSHGEES
ncbi:MAG: hypothetical protein JSU86_20195 [Phycisphaerales bacterium]|nr:MAG: hypothetical protein JSU86_20195 [Phycisphaerales bacterium]